MAAGSGHWIAAGLLAAGLLVGTPAAARQPDYDAYRLPVVSRTLVDTFDLRHKDASRRRQVGADWGSGSIMFDGLRIRSGSKHYLDPGNREQWERGFKARAELDMDLPGGWTGGISGLASYVKQGAVGGPLFTGNNSTRSAELDLSLANSGGARFTVSAFDNGGWKAGAVEDFARAIVSGGDRQKSGVAFEMTGRPNEALGGMSLGLRAESSHTSGLGRDNAVSLSTGWKF